MALGTIVLSTTACGKKGPPLPPFVRIPAAITAVTADRAGDDVYVTVTLPERNIDGSQPASTTRVDVWAYTGRTPPARAKWVEIGTLIGSVDLVPAEPDDPMGPVDPDAPAVPAPQPTPAPTSPKVAVVHERLTPERLSGQEPVGDPALAASVRRFYLAVPVGAKGRPGPLGTVVDLDLTERPGPPAGLSVTYDAARMTVAWTAPADHEAWLAARQANARAAGTVLIPDAAPWRYNVYRTGDIAPVVAAPSPSAAPPAVAGTPRPVPLNASPLTETLLTVPVAFDVETCLTVRALFTADGLLLEGLPAPDVCVTPVDSFPPAPPRQLAALPSGDAIDLIWEASDDPDLAGYHVLRADAPDAPLRQLTTTPVTETRFRDSSVRKGVKYFYAVVAIDSRLPDPNVSAESNRVEEEPR